MLLDSRLHGFVDYMVVVFLLGSPIVFELPEFTSNFTYALAIVHLVLTVCTKFELGIVKLIPFVVHGWIELIVSIALAGFAFYLGSREGESAKIFYLFFAAAVFLTWLLTDYKGRRRLV